MRTSHSHKVINQVQKTILSRELFNNKDKLLIGISGGKDSLTLLDCLFRLGFINLHSIHVRIDNQAPLDFAEFCQSRSDFHVIETDILTEVRKQKRKNYCYACSRLKRKALCRYAMDKGFTKLVFAHHRDDVIETLMLNLLFQREISTMLPVQKLFGGKLEIVRPLYDIAEKAIIRYAGLESLPVSAWQCGLENDNRRAWIKGQVRYWQREFPQDKIADNLFRAVQNVNPDFLPVKHQEITAQISKEGTK